MHHFKMEEYGYTEEALDRRRFIKKVAHLGVASGAAVYFGREVPVISREQKKGLSEVRKKYPNYAKELVDNAQAKVDQYKACQERTNNRCDLVMSTKELIEVGDALRVVERQKTYEEVVEKRTRFGNKMKLNALIVTVAALVEAGIAGRALVDQVGGKIKRKIMHSMGK
jgi:hypothetical protein